MRQASGKGSLWIGALALVFAAVGSARAAEVPAGAPVGAVTSISGAAIATGQAPRNVALHDEVFSSQRLSTGSEGALSVLLDGDAVLELCDDTTVRLREADDLGRRGMSLDGGQVRIVAGGEGRGIVVDTPAGRVVIDTGSVDVAVEADTGETRVAGRGGWVSVRGVAAAAVVRFDLAPGDVIYVRPGEAPGTRYEPAGAALLDPGACFESSHLAAVGVDRGLGDATDTALDRLALAEAAPAPPAAFGGSEGFYQSEAGVVDPCFATGCPGLAVFDVLFLLDDPNGLSDADFCGGACAPLPDPRGLL